MKKNLLFLIKASEGVLVNLLLLKLIIKRLTDKRLQQKVQYK